MLIKPILPCCYTLALCSSPSRASDLKAALQKRQNVPVGTGASVTPTGPAASTSASDGSPVSSDASVLLSSFAVSESTSPLEGSGVTIFSPASSSRLASFDSTSSFSPLSSSSQAAASTSSSSASLDLPSLSQPKASSQTLRLSSRTQQFITTVVTVSGSSTFSHAVTTSRIEAVTASNTPSVSPGLNGGDGGSGKSGLSSGQKRTIIGVVVGVGGAILLGGLGVVVWRIWGKRKTVKNDDYDPMDPTLRSVGHEKTNSGGSNDPFRTHLDQHHNTANPVNAASNF